MTDIIEIRYKSNSDKAKIKEIREIEKIPTNTKLFSFLLEDYFRKLEMIQSLKLKALQIKIRNT
jgi:hypothetical protein